MSMSELILLVLGLVALMVGAEIVVRGASRLGILLGIKPLMLGLTVVAIGTSYLSWLNGQAVKQLFRFNPQFEFRPGQPRPKIVYDPLVPLNTQDIVALLSLFEKAGWDLSRQGGIRDAIIKNLGLPDYIEQKTSRRGCRSMAEAPSRACWMARAHWMQSLVWDNDNNEIMARGIL